jgi:hypothetical protein
MAQGMNMKALILVALVLCLSWSHAEVRSPWLAQAKAAFERYAPASRFHDDATAFGDLNGDGVTDFATFVGDPLYNERGVENLKVAVFLGTAGNTFSFHAVSPAILGHDSVSHGLEIKRQSLFLHRDGSGGCCSHWAEDFQFKMREGQLMLIGIELATIHPEDVKDPDTGVSANVLSGQVIKWAGSGKRRKETRQTVETLKPVPLTEFDYERFTEKWGAVLR